MKSISAADNNEPPTRTNTFFFFKFSPEFHDSLYQKSMEFQVLILAKCIKFQRSAILMKQKHQQQKSKEFQCLLYFLSKNS